MDRHAILKLCDSGCRCETFLAAINVAWGAEGCVIETGCSRGIQGDGNSTPILAEFAAQKGVPFYSCDYDPFMIGIASALPYRVPPVFITADSKQWLSAVDQPVALCYLDSFDYQPESPEPCQRHQLSEFLAIERAISKGGVLLLDDADLPGGGKCKMTEAYIGAIGGWRLLNKGYQLLYVKE